MRLTHTIVGKSPLGRDHVRLSGHIVYEQEPSSPETYWFDVPADSEEFLSGSGNPWLACLTPLAASLGEPLRIDEPVDPLLLKNIRGLLLLWKNWYPELHLIPIEASNVAPAPAGGPGKTAAFFSGGIDAFFTLLRHEDPARSYERISIDELIFVWGFDIPLDRRDGFERTRRAMELVARKLGKKLVVVATNLKTTRLQRDAAWGPVWHGSGIASVGLALEKRYARLLIASTYSYLNLAPWGSHPLTDPLLSTTATQVLHDDACFSRVEKTELVAQSDVALQTLRVCWNSKSDRNCSECNKCFRTMATLEVLGVLDRCTTFDRDGFSVERLSHVFSGDHNDRILLLEVRDLARRYGRADIAAAIDQSLVRSKHAHKWISLARWLGTKPYVWRWETPLIQYMDIVL